MASIKPNTTVVSCPGCGARFAISSSMVGRRARCAACDAAFVVPAPIDAPSAVPSPSGENNTPENEVPEYIGFECRVCGTRMFGRANQVGKRIKCDDCGALSVVPPPPKPKPKNMPAALEGEQYELWDADSQPLPSEILAAEPKYVAIQCRRCGTLMHATDRQVGQTIVCPDCGTTHVVPAPPKTIVRPSVLAPNAQTPILDPAARPAERPFIPAPTHKMVHEERQEAEYARALEKSKRTGKPMEIDTRGRPILPRWPLVSGILPFLFSRGVPVIWLVLSVGFAGACWLLLTGVGMSNGEGAIVGLWLLAGGAALNLICAAAASSVVLQIVMESSEGNREIQQWPSLLDAMGSLLYVVVGGMMSAIPGGAIGHIPPLNSDPQFSGLFVAVSMLLCLPIVLLSQLDINSPWGLVSGRILASMVRCPFSWAFFYLESALLAAICGGATYFVTVHEPDATLWLIPLYIAALILFARLLGRLAWRLAEAMATESE